LFYNAALEAISTIVFISPDSIHEIIDIIEENLNPDLMNNIGDLESNIWKTPEGETYVDGKKNKGIGSKKKMVL
jgi:hypothetical protein